MIYTMFLLLKAMELDLLSLDSVVKFSNEWNARLSPLHVLINNAGIFAMGGWFYCNFSCNFELSTLYFRAYRYAYQ